ncbi:hypothetical protein ISG33_00175 [Glaciecola sp. MH2013]|uniref:hypothetical protein n=1 Tax=Glaciecola sp. MH2013 TaxID=2785524 RepID=UPI00189EF663|nr:hypothetical protein [Glaciecola sp. MH2013]MBF7071811.1 hypothetical protein [Glaciecola sp. MH2013]
MENKASRSISIKLLLTVGIIFLFSACSGPSENSASNQLDSYDELDDRAYTDNYQDNDENEDGDDYQEPYPEYCLSGKVNVTESTNIDEFDCEIAVEGKNRGDINNPNAMSVSVTLQDNEQLNNAGIKYFTLDAEVTGDAPKFAIGTYTLAPFALLSTEQKTLPAIMPFLHDFDSSSSFEMVMPPDLPLFANNSSSAKDNRPPYLLESASFTITHVEDIALDEDEKEQQEMMKSMGMITGKQYVKGTISVSIKQFGSSGNDYGPATFTFASINSWTFMKQ